MELMPGYKQTEVGVIPEDWDGLELVAVCTMKSGEGITASSIDDFSEYPCYGGNGLRGYTTRFTHDGRFALIGRQGALCGNVVSAQGKFFASEHAVVVTPRAGYDIDYLTYVLGEMHLNRYSESSAQPGLSVSKLFKLQLTAPRSEVEQRSIAMALRNVDALLGELGNLIAKKRAIKQATMQELLTGKRRLPGFEGEWEGSRLGELFKFRNGLNKAKEFFGKGTPIVNYMDVFNNSAIYASTLRGRVLLTKQERQAFDVCKGDVFFTRTSETREDIGVASVVLGEVADTAFSGFLLRARPFNNRLEHGFKAYCFQSEEVRAQIVSKASYTTRALTNGRILSEVKMLVPSLPEQLAIASVLADMDAELTALEERLCKAREIKQGMMQQLLTGKIRLK